MLKDVSHTQMALSRAAPAPRGRQRCSITAARPARFPRRLAIKRLGFRLLEFLDVLGRQIVRLLVAGQMAGRFG
jgi:ribosomal protein S14